MECDLRARWQIDASRRRRTRNSVSPSATPIHLHPDGFELLGPSGEALLCSASKFHSRREAFFVACPTRMDAELEKLIESGKLTARAAEQLEKLKPGTYCLHKSWGFGRVAEWNLLLNQILIDFPGKKAHAM